MIIDGVHIAHTIESKVANRIYMLGESPRLRVFTCQPTFATKRFLALKVAHAEKIGVTLEVQECVSGSTTEELVDLIKKVIPETDGIIVQLPFPAHINIGAVLKAIPSSHDVDVIGSEAEALFADGVSLVLPPVVGAIAEILSRYSVVVKDKKVVVVGEGRLVGAPSATWFRQQNAEVQTINRQTKNIKQYTYGADILILGAGVQGLIIPNMIRDGVSIFDAGSSEDTGKLVGDADPACAEKSSIFTPVPGGIGPITVALIFRNLLTLLENREK